MIDWVLNRGYAAFDSSSGWKTRTQYLKCKVIALPIAYSEQLSHKKKINLDIEYRFQEYQFYKISFIDTPNICSDLKWLFIFIQVKKITILI